MALFMLYCRGSSSSTRIYMSALIALVLVCSFSCCSSSSEFLFGSSDGDIGKNVDDMDMDKNILGQNNNDYPLPYRSSSSSIHYINALKNPILSKSRLLNLLLDSALVREEDISHRQYQDRFNNRRYAPQSFHAMRG